MGKEYRGHDWFKYIKRVNGTVQQQVRRKGAIKALELGIIDLKDVKRVNKESEEILKREKLKRTKYLLQIAWIGFAYGFFVGFLTYF